MHLIGNRSVGHDGFPIRRGTPGQQPPGNAGDPCASSNGAKGSAVPNGFIRKYSGGTWLRGTVQGKNTALKSSLGPHSSNTLWIAVGRRLTGYPRAAQAPWCPWPFPPTCSQGLFLPRCLIK